MESGTDLGFVVSMCWGCVMRCNCVKIGSRRLNVDINSGKYCCRMATRALINVHSRVYSYLFITLPAAFQHGLPLPSTTHTLLPRPQNPLGPLLPNLNNLHPNCNPPIPLPHSSPLKALSPPFRNPPSPRRYRSISTNDVSCRIARQAWLGDFFSWLRRDYPHTCFIGYTAYPFIRDSESTERGIEITLGDSSANKGDGTGNIGIMDLSMESPRTK